MSEELREALARYLFEHTAEWRWLASSEDADFEEYVERNQDEWREEADALLSGPLAPLLAAQAAVERVEVLAAKYDRRPPIRSQFAIPTGELRVALDGTP